MTADSSWDVQTGVFTRLTGASAVTLLLAGGVSGVLDHVPAGTEFPYLVIGDASSKPMDSQTVTGSDVTIVIHTYSRGAGMSQLKRIMSAVYDTLHNASFSVPNQTLILCRCLGAEVMLEGDGLTRHGVQRFQVITEGV